MLSSLTETVHRHLSSPVVAGPLGSATGPEGRISLREALSRVPDPRARRGVRYRFLDVLHIIVCAVLSGAATTDPDRPQGGRVPSLATIHRTLARIDAVALDDAVNGWVCDRTREHTGTGRPMVAVDGKRSAGPRTAVAAGCS